MTSRHWRSTRDVAKDECLTIMHDLELQHELLIASSSLRGAEYAGCRSVLCAVIVFGVGALVTGGNSCVASEPDRVEFNRDIRPILSNKCFQCHGPDSAKREAELRLDREQDAKADRNGVPAIKPGRLDNSELIRRITSEVKDERMPPEEGGKQLTTQEIAVLQRWVAEGAVWSPPWSYVAQASCHAGRNRRIMGTELDRQFYPGAIGYREIRTRARRRQNYPAPPPFD
jgi:hypothetical protein